MAKEPTKPVQQSVLDRLIDEEPRMVSEPLPTRSQTVRELKTAVRRDLEWLLNSRRAIREEEARLQPAIVAQSVENYGLPDITNLSLDSGEDQMLLIQLLQTTIARFEPRLRGVRVIAQPQDKKRRILRFTIEGMLDMDPAPEWVSFDTSLELGSHQYKVKGV
jgi:type VI secretion system protein ImpF